MISHLFLVAAGEEKEFDAEAFQENLTITRNEFSALDFTFEDGNVLEIIYSVQVKNDLPVDIWFVNEDNYLLLSGGAQFLFFIDGAAKQVSYAKKIVTLTKYDDYKLVITNYYSNQTIEVDIVGEVRTFEDNEEEDDESSGLSEYLTYILIIIIIILIFVVIVLGVRIQKLNRAGAETKRYGGIKDTKVKTKGKGKKAKDTKHKGSAKKEEKKSKYTKGKGKEKDVSDLTSFCGHCGAPVDTPFCKKCGREV